MKERLKKRYAPKRPNYLRRPMFKKGAEGPRGEHHGFRIPSTTGCARLAALLVEAHAAAQADGVNLSEATSDIRHARHVVTTMDNAGAIIGVCWWHPTYDLEVNEEVSWRDFADLRDYGALVAEELQEASYTIEEMGELLTFLADYIVKEVSEAEVEAEVDFIEGETSEDSPTPIPPDTTPSVKEKPLLSVGNTETPAT